MTEPFRVLLADPPWKFKDPLDGGKWGGSVKHYKSLSLPEIARFPLPPMADDAVLVLCRVAAMQEEALFVCRAWGFKPKAEIVWVKVKRNSTREPRMGLGSQTRSCHETILIATRGKNIRISMSEPSVFFAERGVHSGKPDELYSKIERLYPGPYAELFARRRRPNWTCFGDDLPSDTVVVASDGIPDASDYVSGGVNSL